jgi:vitamin K-dependent gamma-carboxylase
MPLAVAIQRLRHHLAEPVSIQSLVVLRVLFGAILAWDCIRYIRADRIRRYYVDVEMTFPYFGWDIIQPLPEPYIHWAWYLVGVTSLMVMLGLFYRLAIVTFILIFGYFFLLDRAQYLNHNYMVLLYACLLALAPANCAFSLDTLIWPALRSATIPRWPVSAIKLQTEIILIYAGTVKITDDWLRGEPLRMWTAEALGKVWIAPIFQYDIVVLAAAWGTILLHVLGAPLLLWSPTRIWIFAVYTCFHISNSMFFNIGIFPWLTIAVTMIFFVPDWPQRLLRRALGAFEALPPMPAPPPRTALRPLGAGLTAVLAVWFAVQIALPQRQLFFPNLVGWTGDGHRFSWRMRIYDREAEGWFEVVSADGARRWRVDPLDYLTDRQTDAMLTRTDMVHDFAGKLEALWEDRGEPDVAVHAHILKSLNGRPMQPFIDSGTDLTSVSYNRFAPDPWVVPLRTRAAEDRFAEWFPPLPLQKPD